MSAPINTSAESGFTIVEALIAITLFSLLSLLVTGALRFGTKAWQSGDKVATEIDTAAQLQTLLRHMLAGARPRFITLPGGHGYVDFDGSPQSVSFISDPPRSLDRGGRLNVTLSADKQADGDDFVMATQPELGGNDAARTRRVLLSGIQSVTFAYFGSKQAGIDAQWHPTWTKQYALPDLVRIQVKSPPGKTAAWPDIVVAPRIDVDVSCIYDPLTRGCRGR